jgi:hypothetical protein
MPNNPLTLSELQSYAGVAVGEIVQMPSGYLFATPVSGNGPVAYRLFDAGYITLGTINVNRLGTGATGAGTNFLADDNTWKTVSAGVSSFNTRTGVLTLNSTDVTTALGFTPPTTLNALNDVTTPTPIDGQLLRFNSATGQWENWSPTFNAFKIDYDYNLSGAKNGSNTNFNTSSNFLAESTRVFLNGQRLTRGAGYDYVEAGINQISLV